MLFGKDRPPTTNRQAYHAPVNVPVHAMKPNFSVSVPGLSEVYNTHHHHWAKHLHGGWAFSPRLSGRHLLHASFIECEPKAESAHFSPERGSWTYPKTIIYRLGMNEMVNCMAINGSIASL